MIAFVKGILVDKREGCAIIDVNGIGYEVMISNSTLSCLPNIDEKVTLHTYLYVKEDGIALIGFSSLDEKEMFLNLTSVSGIGPKLALTILSGISTSDLKNAIANQNDKLISKIKGVGKKTSERIILELKDKVDAFSLFTANAENFVDENNNQVSDAIEALTSLGINKSQASSMVREVYENGDDAGAIIEKVLKGMSK